MHTATVVILLLNSLFIGAQKLHDKGTPELMEPLMYESENNEILAKISSQLLNTLATIEDMQRGIPLKIAEKRRNKFEFIRFGRK
ncbi:hypothetical protein DICVIV_10752 [Dictyocaulus viviparus]|uniref:Uncharacterized protein n=1 Tax=Dictyocaulus viviparus TaxID=29172 RepID=A0A0D8XLJ7_DICVI|nr:hypothetical protein DICVIV_10752 [Dictyocaulus viviparus]